MTKQFKLVRINNPWSINKFTKEVEDTLNKLSREGWSLEDISFVGHTTAMITISK